MPINHDVEYPRMRRELADAQRRIRELEAENAALKADVLAMGRRLIFESHTTFSPECYEAVHRWKDAILEHSK